MFHFLFMIEAMKIRQSDITQHGIIFFVFNNLFYEYIIY